MGKTAKISMLRKEKGNRDSGTNFQDIFLRLKIGLTLGLSWEKPEQMKSSYINCLFSRTWLVGTEHRTRLRDTDWLANIALSAEKFSCRSHVKAMEVTTVSTTFHATSEGFQPQSSFKLALPQTNLERGQEKSSSLCSQSIRFIHLLTTRGCGPWGGTGLAESGPASLLSSSLQNGRRGDQRLSDVKSELCSRTGCRQSIQWGPGPCMCGEGRPKDGTGIEWKESKKVL